MQNTEWSLDKLYTGLEDKNFKKDFETFHSNLDLLTQEAKSCENVDELVQKILTLENLTLLIQKLYSFLELRLAANTNDTQAESLSNELSTRLAELAPFNVCLQKDIAKHFDVLKKRPELKDLEYYLSKEKDTAQHSLSENEERLIAKLNLSGGSAWETLFDQLTANLEIPFQGETLTLSGIRNLANDKDPKVRKEAYEAELKAYKAIELPLSFALNSIKRQVKGLAQEHRFESALDETLFKSSMSRKTLDALMGAIEKKGSIFHRYLKAKAKYLGHKDALPWWDLFAPIGSLTQTFSIEESKEYLINCFTPLSQDIANLIKRAFEEAWIDFLPRKAKVGGAFCAGVQSLKESRILTNFDGSFSALSTLAHELGHAYHNERIKNERPFNQDYGMPVAETASTFNETHLSLHALETTEDKEMQIALLEAILQNTCQTVCDIHSRYLFETSIFERCEAQRLGPKDCCELMNEAQIKAYGDSIRPDTLHNYMWACKGHYYSSHLSFYNFPYAFGSLLSMGLYSKVQENPEFINNYNEFLTQTPKGTAEQAAAEVGIVLDTEDFWLESLEAFEKLCLKFENLVNEKSNT